MENLDQELENFSPKGLLRKFDGLTTKDLLKIYSRTYTYNPPDREKYLDNEELRFRIKQRLGL
jgi:hypothetical protein